MGAYFASLDTPHSNIAEAFLIAGRSGGPVMLGSNDPNAAPSFVLNPVISG